MLIKNTFLYLIGNVVNRIGAFLLLPIYTTHLSVSDYGILELVYSTISVLSVFLGAGLAHTTLRFYFNNDDQNYRNSVITTNAIITIIISSIFACILVANSLSISELLFENKSYQYLVLILSAIIIFELVSEIYFAYIRAEQKALLYVLVSSIKLFTQLVVSIYLVVYLDMSIHGVLIANLVCVFIVWLYLSFYTLRNCGLSLNLSIIKPVLKYALPFASASIIAVVMANTDKFFIRYYIGLEELGLYGLAMKFALMLSFVLLDPIQKGYGPYRFSIMKNVNANLVYAGVTLVIIDISSLIVLSLAYFLPYVIHFIADPQYWPAISFIPILLIGVMFQAINYNMQTGILINKKTNYLFYIMLIVALFNISANYALIPLYGLYAASIIYSLSFVLMTILTYFKSKKEINIEYSWFKIFFNIALLVGLIYIGTIIEENIVTYKILLFLSFLVIIYFLNIKEHKRTILLVKDNS